MPTKDRVEQWRMCSDHNQEALTYQVCLFQIKMLSGVGTALDVGAQEGQFADRLRCELGVSVSCLERVPGSVRSGKRRFPELTWLLGDVRLVQLSGSYDLITWLNWYFRLNEADRLLCLRKLERVLEPGGHLLVSFGDVNWKRYDVSVSYVLREIATVFDLVSVIKSYEYIPKAEPPPGCHEMCRRWYTSVLGRRRG